MSTVLPLAFLVLAAVVVWTHEIRLVGIFYFVFTLSRTLARHRPRRPPRAPSVLELDHPKEHGPRE